MCTISQRIHEILQKNKFSKRQPDAILNSAAETAQLANQKMADLAAGSAVMPSSPRREVDTADHTHASVVITNPRRRSLTKLIIFELQQRKLCDTTPQKSQPLKWLCYTPRVKTTDKTKAIKTTMPPTFVNISAKY